MSFLKRKSITFLIYILALFSFFYTQKLKPYFIFLTPPPNPKIVKFLSLGDTTFIHRVYSLKIQNFGDSYGRSSPLKYYDYSLIYRWLKLGDSLDNLSEILPYTASYYYSQTTNIQNNQYLAAYLVENSLTDPQKKWWWLYQAVAIYNFKLKNHFLALHLAHILAAIEGDLPIWTKQMTAFIYEKIGEEYMAKIIIEDLLKNQKNCSINEKMFMNHFLSQRLLVK